MKQINKILFTFLIISLLPISALGQRFGPSYKELINQVDIKIQNLMSQRKINRAEQDKINDFVPKVGRWFESYSNIQTKIKEAKGQYGNYNSFSSQKLQQVIQQLEQERIATYNLNGGATIQGVTYYSIEELQSAMTTKSKEVVNLIKEDGEITIALQAADRERDRLVSQLEESNELDNIDSSELRWNGLKFKLAILEGDYKRDSHMLNNANFWCEKTNATSSIKCVHRKYYISRISALYIESLVDTPGKKYNQKELADMIIQARDNSNEIKRYAHSEILFDRQEQINSIKQQLALFSNKTPLVNPSGCWVMVIGSGRRPVITIQENAYGEFDAYITDPGPLDYKRGKRLFTMARINATTFEGTEYSYNSIGIETRIAVRLIITNNRSSIEYRTSDDLLTLLPCR